MAAGPLVPLLLALLSAQAAITPSSSSSSSPSSSPPPPPDASERDELAARAAASSEAAVRATQDLESALQQIRRQIEGLRTSREANEDLRRRLDALEARQDAMAHAAAFSSAPPPPFDDQPHFKDAGFIIRSADGFHVLQPRLHLAPRATLARTDGIPPQGRVTAADLGLRWGQLGIEGYAHSRAFEYRAEMELAGGAPATLDLFAQLRIGLPAGLLGVRAGRFRVPYGFQPSDLLDGRGLTMTDLAAASSAFGLGRDLGLMLIGDLFAGRLQARLAALEGGAAELGGAPSALGWAGRIVAAPLGRLPAVEGDLAVHRAPLVALGGSAYTVRRATDLVARSGVGPVAAPEIARGLGDQNGDGRIDAVRVSQVAAELRAVWRGAALSAEYFHRWEQPDLGGGDRWSNGGYLQASALVWPRALPRVLEVTARLGRTNLPLYGAPAAERALAGQRRDEQAVAITAYLRGHDLKVQVEYAHLVDSGVRPDVTAGPTFDRGAHRLRVQAHLAF